MLKLVEIFCSIQGESTYAGLPCIFIRLAGCNQRCSYCDTEYSFDSVFEMEIEDILKEVKKHSPINLVEITGGEPLLQAEVYDLMQTLIDENYDILLETNGSINMKDVPSQVVKIADVKCPGSGNTCFREENLNYLDLSRDEIKFVLSSREDYNFTKAFLTNHGLNGPKIIFSCVFDRLEPKTLVEWVVEDKLGVRMQLQMHKYIWDPNMQGV